MSQAHTTDDYLNLNRKAWNDKVSHHLNSEFYAQNAFLEGKSSLKEIELGLLGAVSGLRILHLQCHFGQDTLSLQRLGAQVTGVDFSEAAIGAARQANEQLGLQAEFICADIYDLPNRLDEKFDIVFTSYGTIGWLPDLNRWAAVVSHFLKPGGRFVFAEFHPVVWMFDADFKQVAYRYFTSEAIIETESGTYANKDADITNTTISWNHGLAEVVQALLDNDLSLRKIQEFDYSPYACFSGLEEFEPGKFRVAHLDDKIPMVYGLVATKATHRN